MGDGWRGGGAPGCPDPSRSDTPFHVDLFIMTLSPFAPYFIRRHTPEFTFHILFICISLFMFPARLCHLMPSFLFLFVFFSFSMHRSRIFAFTLVLVAVLAKFPHKPYAYVIVSVSYWAAHSPLLPPPCLSLNTHSISTLPFHFIRILPPPYHHRPSHRRGESALG